MRWFLVLGLLAAIYCYALADHYKTLGVARTATQSQIRSAFQSLSKKWHPDKNTEPGANDKYKEIIGAYEVLSDATKRNEYELSIRPGHWGSGNRQSSVSETVELTTSNWDWHIRVASRGQPWLVLFCGDSYKGCLQAYAEWEKAYQLVGAYSRMGRVNVEAQWSIVSNFGIRYVPALYTILDGELKPVQHPITAEAIYGFVRSSLENVFKPIRSLDEWQRVFDWESTLKRESVDFPEKVKVVLFTDDANIPLKWRYWGRQYAKDLIQWYAVHPSSANRALLEHLSVNFGISHAGVAMLFPNPRDNSEVVILADGDTNGRSVELTSADLEDWLKTLAVPKLAKLDSSNFLQIVGNTHYTLAMAVDTSIGTTPGNYFGNSRLKRFNKLIEPMVTLWEQRRGSSLRDLQFTWLATHKQALVKCFGFTKSLPSDGNLLLIDRRRWEYALLPLDIDRDDVSTIINMIAKYSQRQLPMKKFLCVPQATDEAWSLSDALLSASGFGYWAIGFGILTLILTWIVAKSNHADSNTQSRASSKSSSKKSKPNKTNSREEAHSSKASSSSEKPDLFNITLKDWQEINSSNYATTLSKRHFTLILFPRLAAKDEVKAWQNEISIASEALSTDSISITWIHSHREKRYLKYWMRHCEMHLSSENDEGTYGKVFGILIRTKGQKFMIFSGEDENSQLKSEILIPWVQRVLEGQTSWIDIPNDAPSLS